MSDLVVKIDQAIETGIAAADMAGKMSRAIAVATAVEQIRDLLIHDVIKPIMALQNRAIGFKTDKDPSQIDRKTGKPNIPYSEDVVRDCLIEAVLNGVYPVGNEFNIIAGRCYITREGMTRKLSSIKGLSYSIMPGIPQGKDGGAIVEMTIDYNYNGNSQQVKIPICVRINDGMGTDAVLGKADRKAKAWLYRHITGKEVPEGDIDEVQPIRQPKQSPFEKRTDVVDAEVIKPTIDTSSMSKEDLVKAVEKIIAENVTDSGLVSRWLDGKKLDEIPDAQLKQIVKNPDRWVKALK